MRHKMNQLGKGRHSERWGITRAPFSIHDLKMKDQKVIQDLLILTVWSLNIILLLLVSSGYFDFLSLSKNVT